MVLLTRGCDGFGISGTFDVMFDYAAFHTCPVPAPTPPHRDHSNNIWGEWSQGLNCGGILRYTGKEATTKFKAESC